MEQRLARLEAKMEHLRADLSEARDNLGRIKNRTFQQSLSRGKILENFQWLLIGVVGTAAVAMIFGHP